MKNIIILKHANFESPYYILNILKRRKIKYEIVNVYKNVKFPDINSFDFLIIMGGPMGVYEERKYPWLKDEKNFIKKSIKKGKKILGICLGAQLIAECLGGKVYKNKYKEIGWFPVYLTPDAKRCYLFKEVPERFITFHWHNDTFTIPDGAIHLAYSQACKNQAFVYGNNIIALQFHPEITRKSLEAFIKNERYVKSKNILIDFKENIDINHKVIESIISKMI
jgi:GMP synthase-like glutamine amidotransferase